MHITPFQVELEHACADRIEIIASCNSYDRVDDEGDHGGIGNIKIKITVYTTTNKGRWEVLAKGYGANTLLNYEDVDRHNRFEYVLERMPKSDKRNLERGAKTPIAVLKRRFKTIKYEVHQGDIKDGY